MCCNLFRRDPAGHSNLSIPEICRSGTSLFKCIMCIYFVEDLFVISDFQNNSTFSCILRLSVFFPTTLGGVLPISSNTEDNLYRHE